MSIISKFQDLYQVGKDEAQLRNPDLTNWEAGSINDTVIGSAAAIGDEVVVTALRRLAETFVDTAEGDALDVLAWDHWQLERIASVKAVGSITLTRATTDAGDVTVEVGSLFATDPAGTDDEVVFKTTETKTLTGLSVTITAEAVEGGTSGNVTAGTITVIKTTLDDASISASNSSKFVGGADEESDDRFRDRIKKYLETLRRATVGAVEAAALQVGGVFFAALDESTAASGYVTLYIADEDGNSNATLEAAVLAELINWRACGITINVDGATAVEQDIDMTLTYQAGVDTEAVRLAAIAAARAYRDGLNVAETMYLSALTAVVQAVPGIKAVTINDPSGNVAPSADEIIRGGDVVTS